MSEDEAEQLERRAREEGVTVARLLVETTLTGEPPSARREMRRELQAMRRQLAGACANLNQAVRALHSSGSTAGLEQAAMEVRAMVRRLEAVAR